MLYHSKDDSILTAVLDLSAKELFIPRHSTALIPSLCLPDADLLTSRLCAYSTTSTTTTSTRAKTRGTYALSSQQLALAKDMHDVLSSHMSVVAQQALQYHRKTNSSGTNNTTANTGHSQSAAGEGTESRDSEDVGRRSSSLCLDIDLLQLQNGQSGSNPADPADLLDFYSKIIADPSASSQPFANNGQNSNATGNNMQTLQKMFSYSSASSGPPDTVSLRADLFVDADEDAFMERFVRTQVSLYACSYKYNDNHFSTSMSTGLFGVSLIDGWSKRLTDEQTILTLVYNPLRSGDTHCI
jgi:hypothetical protein